MECNSITTEQVCYENAVGFRQSLVAHYEYGLNAAGKTILVSTHYTRPDGVTVVDTVTGGGAVTVGVCPGIDLGYRYVQPGGKNIASGSFVASHDPDGNGSTFAGLGAHPSFTVTAIKSGTPASGNAVRVIMTGSQVYLSEDETKTWNAPLPGQYLELGWSVECLGNSAATVTWTF